MYEEAVKQVEIFKDLSALQLKELYSWLERRDFPEGTMIFKEGQLPNGLYLLTEGSVTVLKGSDYGKMKLSDIEAPSFFGEMGLLNGKQRSAGIRASSNVITGFLPADLFATKLRGDNLTALRIGINLGRILCSRLSDTSTKLAKKSAIMAKRRPPIGKS